MKVISPAEVFHKGLRILGLLLIYAYACEKVHGQLYQLQCVDSIIEKDSAKVLFNLNPVWLTQNGIWEYDAAEQTFNNGNISLDASILNPTKNIGRRIQISTGGSPECVCENNDSIYLFNGIQVFVYDKSGIFQHKSSRLTLNKYSDTKIFGENSKYLRTACFHSGCKELRFEICEDVKNRKVYKIANWKYDNGSKPIMPDDTNKNLTFEKPVIFTNDCSGSNLLISFVFDDGLNRQYSGKSSMPEFPVADTFPGDESLLFSRNWGNIFSCDSNTFVRIQYYPITSRNDNPFARTEQEYYAKPKSLEIHHSFPNVTRWIPVPERLEFIGNRNSTLYFRNLFPGTIYVYKLVQK